METLSYGLTLPSKGQEIFLNQLDAILHAYCHFSVQQVVVTEGASVFDDRAVESAQEKVVAAGPEKETLEKKAAAYWTTLAPNVEDYSGSVARAIASGSGKVAKGILWCGDVTAERLKWGNEFLMKKMKAGDSEAEVSQETLKRIKRYAVILVLFFFFMFARTKNFGGANAIYRYHSLILGF
jgi:spartin